VASSDADWTIRPSRPGDEPRLTELFQRAFGRPVDEAHWRWKLEQLPSPVPNDWLALDGQRAIFHSGGIPLRYQLPDGEGLGMVSVDTMTDPDYRRRGLLTQVAGRMYATWREAGVRLVIGLINDQWRSRAPALGWQPLFPLRWVIRPLRPTALLSRRLGRPVPARLGALDAAWNWAWDRRLASRPSVKLRHVDAAGPWLDGLWWRCAPGAGASIVRDSGWVNWRYLQSPTLKYRVVVAQRAGQPVGYAAYRVEQAAGRRLGYLAEVLAPVQAPHVWRALVHQVCRSLIAAGADLAAAQVPPGTWAYDQLRRAGFVWSWGDFSVQLVPLDPSLPMARLRHPRNWTMWGGDYDSI
jgi:hypothetical protein